MILLASPRCHLLYYLLCTAIFVSFDYPGYITQTLHLSDLALKVGTDRIIPSYSFPAITDLIVRLMITIRATSIIGIGVSIYQCNPLNIVADMMIVLVSSHNEVFLGLLETEIPHRFRPLPTYVDVSEVLPRLTIQTLLVS